MPFTRKQRTFIRASEKYSLNDVLLENLQISELSDRYKSKVITQSALLTPYTKGKILCTTSTKEEDYNTRIKKYKQYVESVKFTFPCVTHSLCFHCYSNLFNGKLGLPASVSQYHCYNTQYINQHLIKSLPHENYVCNSV